MAASVKSVLIRLATAAVILPVALCLIWIDPLRPGLIMAVGMLAGIGLYEYYAIVRARAISPETIGGIIGGTLVCVSGAFSSLEAVNLMLYGGCLLVAALHIVRGAHSVAGLASSVFGVFYVGWLAAHIVLIHRTEIFGPSLLTMLFVAVILTDTGAFAVGSIIGKHKLAPRVSPNKTWEGAAGGMICAVLGMLAIYGVKNAFDVASLPNWSIGVYIRAGIFLSFVAQIGDLTESVLKRDAGVKDSGGIFPGHGGVLDRCDGFLFAAPALYYLWQSLPG
jgi:phosphatidate cytidylyltransferase